MDEEKEKLLKEYEDFCVEVWTDGHLHGFGSELMAEDIKRGNILAEKFGQEEVSSACKRGRIRWRKDILPGQPKGILDRYRDPKFAAG